MPKQKIKGAPNAVGYWGRDMATHVAALQTGERVLALNRDKVFGMGLPFRAWLRVQAPMDRSVQCSCWNETAQQSDVPCLSCYGHRLQPGFVRFGYQTIFYSSIHNDLQLTNLQLNKVVTPFRLELTPGATTGSLVTPIYTILDINYGSWEVHLDAFNRDQTSSTITLEFTTNGVDWVEGTPVVPALNSTIQFRVTLARASTAIKSPLFEILRARFPVIPSPRERQPLPAGPGDILLLKTWDVERFKREQSGAQTETEGERYWTVPLNFFDERIDRESKDAVLGQDHFIEEKTGPEAGVRYVATKHAFSRNYKLFTRQDFNLRRVIGDTNNKQSGEAIMRVW